MHNKSSIAALVILALVLSVTIHSAISCWKTTQQLKQEIQTEQQSITQKAQRWRHRATLHKVQLEVRRATAASAVQAQQDKLRRLEQTQQRQAQRTQETHAKTISALNRDLLAHLPDSEVHNAQGCLTLMGSLKTPASQVGLDFLRGDIQTRAAQCEQQMQALIQRLDQSTNLLKDLPVDLDSRLKATQGQTQAMQRHFQHQFEALLSLEALRRDLALRQQALQSHGVDQRQQQEQWALAQKQLHQQTWFDRLTAKGASAWLWWLHLGTTALGSWFSFLLLVRLAHLRGWGQSLHLPPRRSL